MKHEVSQSKLFITGGEYLYQLEVRGMGGGQVLAWRTRMLDPHTRHPYEERYEMTDTHIHTCSLALENSWIHLVRASGETGQAVEPIVLSFTEEEF